MSIVLKSKNKKGQAILGHWSRALTFPSISIRKLQTGSGRPAEVEPGDELSLPVGVRHSSDEDAMV